MEKPISPEGAGGAEWNGAHESSHEHENYEKARDVLFFLGNDDLIKKILAYPELKIFLSELSTKGIALDSSFYSEVKKYNDEIAGEFLVALHKNNYLAETHLKKVVGNLSTAEKEESMLMHQLFIDQRRRREVDVSEREKTELELAVIQRSEISINNLRSRLGLESVHFPPERVVMKKITKADIAGEDKPSTQETYIYETLQGIARFAAIHHELLHAADYQAVQAYRVNGKVVAGGYRGGLTFWNTVQRAAETGVPSRRHLDPLNEAIKEEWSRRFILSLRDDDPVFGVYAQQRKEELNEFEREMKTPPEDFYGTNGDERNLKFIGASYREERQAMWRLFDIIYDVNKNDFVGMSSLEAREILLDLVTKAGFTGDLVQLGRLIEKTFGEGSFRKYCECRTANDVFDFLEEAKQ